MRWMCSWTSSLTPFDDFFFPHGMLESGKTHCQFGKPLSKHRLSWGSSLPTGMVRNWPWHSPGCRRWLLWYIPTLKGWSAQHLWSWRWPSGAGRERVSGGLGMALKPGPVRNSHLKASQASHGKLFPWKIRNMEHNLISSKTTDKSTWTM